MSLIKLKGISKSYGQKPYLTKALDNINLNVEQGEMLSIIGKSGSGKSTLLNIIGGLDKADNGRYLFNGTEIDYTDQRNLISFRRNYIGYVMQSFALINEFTVYDNVALPLKYSDKKDIDVRVKSILKRLGIMNKAHNYAFQLSGGEAQRVAIARALIKSPKLLLADEPTGALDEKNGENIMSILDSLNINDGQTIIIVTHDNDISKRCSRIVELSDGRL